MAKIFFSLLRSDQYKHKALNASINSKNSTWWQALSSQAMWLKGLTDISHDNIVPRQFRSTYVDEIYVCVLSICIVSCQNLFGDKLVRVAKPSYRSVSLKTSYDYFATDWHLIINPLILWLLIDALKWKDSCLLCNWLTPINFDCLPKDPTKKKLRHLGWINRAL